VFADEGGIVGSVAIRFRSATRAAASPAPDPLAAGPPVGLAGVRLYLDDGTWAVTDAQGRFSFTAVTPRTHALKLDRTTLPPHSFPVSVDHRDQGTPGLRFVDLTRGDLAHAEFLIIADTASAPEVKERMIAAQWRDEGTRVVAQSIERPEQRALPGDARSLPAAAIVTGEHETGAGTPTHAPQGPPGTLAARAHPATPVTDSTARPVPLANLDEDLLPDGSLPDTRGARASTAAATASLPQDAPLEQLLPTLGPEPGFIGLADMDTLASTSGSRSCPA
jgi:hypothetical protein